MIVGSYTVDVQKIIDEIRNNVYSRVVLQLPDGIKRYSTKIVDEIENKTKAEIIISTDPCYGACDLIDKNLDGLNVDLLIQIGHLPIPNITPKIPTLFINAYANSREEEAVKRAIEKLEGERVGVLTTAQHIHKLKEICEILEDRGFEAVLGKGSTRIVKDGQVLGCNTTSASSIADRVDCFLFLGSGMFHPLGIALSSSKPVIATNPFNLTVVKDEIQKEKNRFIRKRYGLITVAKDAKTFAILISTKPGQTRLGVANIVENKLKKHNKKVYRLIADSIDPTIIKNFPDVDCIISTACPRVAIDEAERFDIPILTPTELEIMFGERSIEEYKLDEIY